jgi:hypothetical protein
MDQDLIKTKTCADVIPVRMRLQDAWTPQRERGHETGEVPGARTRIQHRDVMATFDQVALHVFAVMRLADHRHRVRKPPHLEPTLVWQIIPPQRRAPLLWLSRDHGLLIQPSHQAGQLLVVELAEER